MAKIERFEDLHCWQQARELTNEIYWLKGAINKDHVIRDQIRRASLSIMNNIAEGFTRFSNREKIRFLEIAQSSSNEVKSMLYLLEDQQYLTSIESQELRRRTDLVRTKILAFIKYLNNNKR